MTTLKVFRSLLLLLRPRPRPLQPPRPRPRAPSADWRRINWPTSHFDTGCRFRYRSTRLTPFTLTTNVAVTMDRWGCSSYYIKPILIHKCEKAVPLLQRRMYLALGTYSSSNKSQAGDCKGSLKANGSKVSPLESAGVSTKWGSYESIYFLTNLLQAKAFFLYQFRK